MKIVSRQNTAAAQVVPIHAGSRIPAVGPDVSGLVARLAQLETQFAQMVKAHNATVEKLDKLQKEHVALTADHMTLKRGASSLAKHFQGFVAAAQIQYAPAVVQRQPAPAARPAAAMGGAPRTAPAAPPPASQTTVNAAPAAPAASGDVWAQREELFYQGGEGEED